MTGGRCHRRRKMMGRGADGGCGTEEKPCPTSRFPTKIPAKQASILEKHTRVDIDFYTQARKALCERSPFDTEDAVSTIATLPSGLANFLSKHLDSRKRHKKSHSGVEAKSSRAGGAKSRGSNFWAETEEYFRELTMDDIKKLYEVSSFGFSASGKCFSIPFLGNAFGDSAGNGYVANGANDANANGANGANVNGAYDVNVNGVGSNCKVVEEEVKKFMEVDSVGINGLPQEEKGCSSLLQSVASSSGLDWLLGSRNKIYLTSDRPSKKRKLLGGDAGLEKLLIAYPVEGSSSLCHYCSLGDMGDQLNRLIVCSSCNVAVHQRCYGVQDDVAGSWLCSWCKLRNEVQSTDRPCLLCPKQGGALKPVRKRAVGSESDSYMEFAHLFCCQWMPEVYIEDTRTMEPIMNVEGIKETRRKLVCYLCKVKCGACVRCSNGACRTSFHPICAREARHRMEIWGKFGCDDVELRAFCSKHSEVESSNTTQQSGDLSVAVGSNSCTTEHQPVTSTVNKPHKLKIGRKNGDKIAVHIETSDSNNNNKLGDSVLNEDGLLDTRSNSRLQSECGDAQQHVNVETGERNNGEDANSSDSLNFTLILKKLIDRGKVNVKDVALEIGVSPDSLASMLSLQDDCLVSDLHCKVVKWLGNHAYISTLQKNLKVKIKSTIASKDEMRVTDDSDAITVSESDIPDVVPVKSVPPRRRTKSNIRISKDNKVICPSKEVISDDGIVLDEVKKEELVNEDPDYSSKASVPDATKKFLIEPVEVQDTLASNSPKPEGDSAKPLNCSPSEGDQTEEAAISEQNAMVNQDLGNPICSVVMNHIPDLIKAAVSSSYIHPLIHNKLMQMQNGMLSENTTFEFDGSRDREISPLEASFSSGICCNQRNQHSQHSTSSDMVYKFDGVNLEQLVKARNMGVLEQSPEDEVEGELIFYQHKLICNAVERKSSTDDLICKVVKSLPQEIDAAGKQKWDAVLVNQYLCELREAKKQGRKERRHKEAQAVLAAATAAAAASSRISSFRKDTLDESSHQESMLKVNTSSGRAGFYSQQNPRAKETLSRLAVTRVSSEKNSDFALPTSDFCKEHPRTCDICRRSETILNPFLVCSSCKVAVHLDCYRSVKDSTGPWYCELCEDLLSSRCSGAPAVNSWEKPYFVAECGLCGGTAGAFRKSTDGQWIHAFCAEWVLESTFRRGQVNPVEGMELVSKGGNVCHICRRKQGVCIKCNYGHCQSTFHPSCARSAGYYMNVKTLSGKLQHKAYCEKHSLEQRTKAETQKHGIEELKSLKQVRVELERLRLLCERIIKREKLKRELVLCSHDILASNRDTVALSALVHSPFFAPDVSSESATTSLKGHMDDYRSGSEAIQRSDDITVDSTVSGKHHIKFPMSMDNDQKTDDSSTSQHLFMQKPVERALFSGKQIPHRQSSVASQNLSDDGEKRSKSRKHTETFEKELVMTSDQASMKNQRLPKGFVYVPIRCLSKEKETIQDACSGEPLGRDG
uniref:PHD finger family protein n=1 Tax=Davidia involucrata TaxID=16924 RepID=A0A5B7AIV8_DAVIN